MRSTDKGIRALFLFGALCLIPSLGSLCLSQRAFAQQSERCAAAGLAAPAQPLHFAAKVQGVAPPDEVRRQTAIAERRTGGAISPDYVDFPRIIAIYVVNGVAHSTIAAVVDGHIPQPGDTVELASRYRDPRSPCHFIPWTVVPVARQAVQFQTNSIKLRIGAIAEIREDGLIHASPFGRRGGVMQPQRREQVRLLKGQDPVADLEKRSSRISAITSGATRVLA